MIVILVGKMASGKTTIAKILEEKYGYDRIVTYTTREPRPDEKDGIDYHFVSEDEFSQKSVSDFFLEQSLNPDGDYYGSAKEDYEMSDNNKVIVLDPRGAESIRQWEINNQKFFSFIVYLDAPEEVLVTRALDRGDGAEYIGHRIGKEGISMAEMIVNQMYNYKITTSDKEPEETARIIVEEVGEINHDF